METHQNHIENIAGIGGFGLVVTLLLIILFLVYPLAAYITSRKFKKWPLHRYIFWGVGILTVGAALIAPSADLAYSNFTAHMIGHLLLGMLAPLFLLAAAPMKLILRTLQVPSARKLTFVLKSRPVQFITNPLIASAFNLGGLYVLYTTDLYSLMHQSLILHIIVHFHVFLAGYVFTASIIYMDVTPHRYHYTYRTIVLILSLAGHKILSKHIYAYPPAGVGKGEAEAGGMLMYYGGDFIDAVLIIILCYHWYKAAAPKKLTKKNSVPEPHSI